MRALLYLFILLLSGSHFVGQQQNTNGVHSKNVPSLVFSNATLHIDAQTVVENGTLIIKDNKIIYAGPKTKLPENAIEKDLKGKHIYPSFIELNGTFGQPELEKKKRGNNPQYESSKKGAYYWNEAIHPEIQGYENFTYNDKEAEKLRKKGFGSVLSHQADGISRGSGMLVSLTDQTENQIIHKSASEHFSLKKGNSAQAYPSSMMGSIALIRQYFYDLLYYQTHQETEKQNLSLDAGIDNQPLTKFFSVNDKLSLLRAEKIAKEFGLTFHYFGNGDEYQELNALKKELTGTVVIPLDFPKPYDVEDPFHAMSVTLTELKHWELAPSNAAFLENAKIPFAISGNAVEKESEFLDNLRLAVERGMSIEKALDALTKTPAELLNQYEKIGSLHSGKIANFLITTDELFLKNGIVLENWVQGDRYVLQDWDIIDVRGDYNLNVNQIIRTLKIKGSPEKPKGTLEYDIVVDSVAASGDLVIDKVTGKPIKVTQSKTVDVSLTVEKKYITLSYTLTEGSYRLGGTINFDSGSWDGRGQMPSGEWLTWTAIRKKKEKEKEKEETPPVQDSVGFGKFMYPMVAYGWDSLPTQRPILIKNATVWTLEAEGTIQSDVFIRNGKISNIAKILDVVDKSTLVIDGTGMHLTPGIIDEHSHIAIANGVNEGSHAVTAEVRIGDVIKNDDINIYRQLAGGVTACQLLHGSANPVGGQSALIKLRWGAAPEDMKITGADGFIKFALGENVKQSNWGDFNTIRFPQTRMGVEQVYYDAFIRAKEYEREWLNYSQESSKKKNNALPPKRDLQMDALVEILNSKRFITCHSYVQSEINMLMHMADSMGFRINTFTHILEGYKVADKMKEHGVGGSTFSDWWAYKYEVKDAIPYNASLLNQIGVVTSINSDDAEMGRRLNQEAAKGIKYGGMTEEEALKMVTLNPAKLLHLDHQMGSIKVGKDADVVLWTDNPLSIYAKVQNTIIDGIVYFDAARDKQMQAEIEQERSRIISKMIAAKNGGSETQKVKPKKQQTHVCTSVSDENDQE